MAGKPERAHYRLRYPAAIRPTFRTQAAAGVVSELSESGLKCFIEATHGFHVGQTIVATIQFHDGEREEVSGTVARVGRTEVAVRLDRLISLRRIMEQQRLILSKYPARLEPPPPA